LLLISVIAPKVTEALRRRSPATNKDHTKKSIREVENEKPTH